MQTNDFHGFDAVWQRVQEPSFPLQTAACNGHDSSTAPLEAFINRETAFLSAYTALAHRWRGAFCAAAFHRAAKDTAGRIRRLEAAYFLLSGDSFAPGINSRPDTEMPEALRSLWLAHNSTASAYDRAATADSQNTALWHQHAAQHRRQMETLFGIIQHFMK